MGAGESSPRDKGKKRLKFRALSIRPKIPEIPGKSEWKGHFPQPYFGILGAPREVVPIFRKIGITGKFCSTRPFLLGPVSPRPKTEGQHGYQSADPMFQRLKLVL